MAHDACSDEWRQRHARDADALAYVGAWCRLRAQDRGAILCRERRKERFGGFEPAAVAAREVDDGPIAAPEKALRTEALDEVIDPRLQRIR